MYVIVETINSESIKLEDVTETQYSEELISVTTDSSSHVFTVRNIISVNEYNEESDKIDED